MKFYVGQYLEFENAVAKITRMGKAPGRVIDYRYPGKGMVKMRRMTIGTDYDYQHIVSEEHLKKLYKEGKVKAVDYLEILRLLSSEFMEDGGNL